MYCWGGGELPRSGYFWSDEFVKWSHETHLYSQLRKEEISEEEPNVERSVGWLWVDYICFSCFNHYLSLCRVVHEYYVYWWQKVSDCPCVLHRWSTVTPIVFTVHRETTCTAHMQEIWSLPETSDSSHTWWKVDPRIAGNLWWRNYSSLVLCYP